jgi:hypothetical protein
MVNVEQDENMCTSTERRTKGIQCGGVGKICLRDKKRWRET